MIIITTKESNKNIGLEIGKEGLILSIIDKSNKSNPKLHLSPEQAQNLKYWLQRYEEKANIENEFQAEGS